VACCSLKPTALASGYNSHMSKQSNTNFIPSQPSTSLIWLFQHLSLLGLCWHNKIHISQNDLNTIRSLPRSNGILFTPNHSDELDPRVCFELARKTKHPFVFMCNREAFNEYGGLAGWGLQRIGAYSVERGGHDTAALDYSVHVLKDSRQALVIFPEGEILYLNQSVQPFHSGAIAIGMRAIAEKRASQKDWTTLLVPIAIRYQYSGSIRHELERRIERLESHHSKTRTGLSAESRLDNIMDELITEKELRHHITIKSDHYMELARRVEYLRKTLLAQVSQKYKGSYKEQARTLDKAFQIDAHLRERLAVTVNSEHQEVYKEDLSTLKEVEHLVAWHPDYVKENPSPERIAEMVIKLERELLNIKRPTPLGKRDVFVKIGTPYDLSRSYEKYKTDPYSVRSELAEMLRTEIQSLIDAGLAKEPR
jgi:1-acyl-sn-glycerol-3-phosphate acyltransferase